MEKEIKRAIVVSGGGSKGAFAVGVAKYLIKDLGNIYDIAIGSSTGSLTAPLLALGEIDKLEEAYTTVRVNDIFKSSPFSITKQSDGTFNTRMNYFSIFNNLVFKGQKSIGDSSNLRKTISKFFTEEDFYNSIKLNKNIIACVSNITLEQAEYKTNLEYSYKDFCDWMWISCNVPIFMSLVEKNGYEYVDGGVMEHAPISEAIARGATDIDVIILRPQVRIPKKNKTKNILNLLSKIVDLMSHEITTDDILIARLEANNKNVNINFYYTPRELTDNSLLFDKDIMKGWLEEGYQSAKKEYCKQFNLNNNKAKLIYDGLST
jgi:NTE family protein